MCLSWRAATLLKVEEGSLPEGKVKIRLETDGSLLEVDEDDVEKVICQLLTVLLTILLTVVLTFLLTVILTVLFSFYDSFRVIF